MELVGAAIWLGVLLFLLQLAVPDRQTRSDGWSLCAHVMFGSILIGLTIYVQFQVMSGFHHGKEAVALDAVGGGVFVLGRAAILMCKYILHRRFRPDSVSRFPESGSTGISRPVSGQVHAAGTVSRWGKGVRKVGGRVHSC